MKSLKIAVLTSFLSMVLGCDDSVDADSGLEPASILSSTTVECYCCPGLSIEVGGDTIFVENIHDNEALHTALGREVFPIDVLLKTSTYTGDCPNREFEITHIKLSE